MTLKTEKQKVSFMHRGEGMVVLKTEFLSADKTAFSSREIAKFISDLNKLKQLKKHKPQQNRFRFNK